MTLWLRSICSLMVLTFVGSACAPATEPHQAPSTSGNQPSAAQPAPGKKRLAAAMFADPAGFHHELTNPGGSRGSVPGLSELWQLTHAGLSYLDDDQMVQPWLIDALPTVENGLWRVLPDGRMETTFRLKPNILWHDGTPFGPDDLTFSAKVYQDKEIDVLNPPALRLVEAIEAPDQTTIVVKWREPFIEADTIFSPQFAMPLAKHILERDLEEDKGGFLALPYWRGAFVGVGPYKVQEWVEGSHVTLVANDQYVLGRPRVDEIEVRFFTERNALVASILAGAVERPIGRGLSLDNVVEIRDAAPEVNVLLGDRVGNVVPMYPQFINTDPPIVTNLEFRRALLMAIDRQAMSDALNFGFGRVAHQWIQPDRPEYKPVEPKIVRYDHDPRRATQMIEALGYRKGGDGIFRDAQGQNLALRLQTTEGAAIQPPSALAVVNDWRKLGVDATFESVPNQRLRDREYRSQFPSFELVTSGLTPQSSRVRGFHGSSTPLPENNFSGRNRARYRNAELNALIDRYLVTIPLQQRYGVLGDIIHHQTDQLTIMPLFFQGRGQVLGQKKVKNVTSQYVWNAHLWDIAP